MTSIVNYLGLRDLKGKCTSKYGEVYGGETYTPIFRCELPEGHEGLCQETNPKTGTKVYWNTAIGKRK